MQTQCWCPYHAVWEEPERRRVCDSEQRVSAWVRSQMQQGDHHAALIKMWTDGEAKYSAGIRRPRRWLPRARYWTGRGLRRLADWIDS